jgi:mannose-6-phosphate isomerase class I
LQLLNNEKGFCEELVCNFNEFKATRVKLNKNHLLSLEPINTYRLLFLVEGHLEIAKNSKALDFNTISKGECIFLSALNSYHIRTVDNATFLFCLPNS